MKHLIILFILLLSNGLFSQIALENGYADRFELLIFEQYKVVLLEFKESEDSDDYDLYTWKFFLYNEDEFLVDHLKISSKSAYESIHFRKEQNDYLIYSCSFEGDKVYQIQIKKDGLNIRDCRLDVGAMLCDRTFFYSNDEIYVIGRSKFFNKKQGYPTQIYKLAFEDYESKQAKIIAIDLHAENQTLFEKDDVIPFDRSRSMFLGDKVSRKIIDVDSGGLFISMPLIEKIEGRRDKGRRRSVVIYHLDKNSNFKFQMKIQVDNGNINNLYSVQLTENTFLLHGTYSIGDRDFDEGIYSCQIEKNNSKLAQLNLQFTPFDEIYDFHPNEKDGNHKEDYLDDVYLNTIGCFKTRDYYVVGTQLCNQRTVRVIGADHYTHKYLKGYEVRSRLDSLRTRNKDFLFMKYNKKGQLITSQIFEIGRANTTNFVYGKKVVSFYLDGNRIIIDVLHSEDKHDFEVFENSQVAAVQSKAVDLRKKPSFEYQSSQAYVKNIIPRILDNKSKPNEVYYSLRKIQKLKNDELGRKWVDSLIIYKMEQ
ncbi:MAG: hypothetical protein GQ574_05150 [Crocinitomix sp.]|nr:hypothetical protein [Crocinitomix sp.]